MLSLLDRISLLENDLKAVPPRITVHHNLPFAILRYEPKEEWDVRREAKRLATRINDCGKEVVTISLAELLWEAIAAAEGLDSIVELEREQGFEAAQEQVNIYLSDQDWCPLPDLLAQRLKALDPQRHIVFLLRSASMAPAIYQMSKLLDEMQGKTRIATILFYPGTLEGTTGLRMMALKNREAMGNYRVKIYG
ncbi:MAG: BREX protein BrxB domain-containing protein [Nostoc sp.]|uniref:BREX protein BrxB domain-containing protein n=1 Tax=Nostoc sp. TaxID=1180 RepID=UPI002FF252AE